MKSLHGIFDRFACAAHYCLTVAVDVGDHHIAIDCLQDSLHFLDGGKHCCHAAVVVHCHLGHAATAGADGFERVGKGKTAGCNQRAVFAQAVSHREVGFDAVSGEQPGQRQVGCEYGGLSNCGLAQVVFRFRHRVRVSLVDEDEFAERLAKQRRHDAIRFRKSFGNDRLCRPKQLQHVHVLRALTGIQERNFGTGAVAAKNPLRAQPFPHRGLIGRQRFQRVAGFNRQFGRVAIVDSQAFGRPQIRFSRRRRRRCLARFRVLLDRPQALDQLRFGGCADYQCSTQRSFAGIGTGSAGKRSS